METSSADGNLQKPFCDSATLEEKVRSLIENLKHNNFPIAPFRNAGLETSGGIDPGSATSS
jgi:hypothetical protein